MPKIVKSRVLHVKILRCVCDYEALTPVERDKLEVDRGCSAVVASRKGESSIRMRTYPDTERLQVGIGALEMVEV